MKAEHFFKSSPATTSSSFPHAGVTLAAMRELAELRETTFSGKAGSSRKKRKKNKQKYPLTGFLVCKTPPLFKK